MGCQPSNFVIGSRRKLAGHDNVEIADAKTRPMWIGDKGLKGVVYWMDGRFQGFTGNDDAVRYWIEQRKESAV